MLVLLDLDGTLVDRDAGFAAWAEQLATQHHLDGSLRAWVHEADKAFRRRDVFFQHLTRRLPQLGPHEEVWAEYRRRMPALTPAFPGVADALAALRAAGWHAAVVTNGTVANQVGKLRQTGLIDLVDGLLASEAVGRRKPDRAIFDAARQRWSSAPGDAASTDACWMVGDDPVADVTGGAAAGMTTVWVSHGRSWPAGLRPPDLTALTPAAALRSLLPADGLA